MYSPQNMRNSKKNCWTVAIRAYFHHLKRDKFRRHTNKFHNSAVSIHIQYTFSTLSVHFQYTFSTLSVHFQYTFSTLSVHFQYTFSTLSVHFQYTFSTLSVHFQYTFSKLSVHFQYTFIDFYCTFIALQCHEYTLLLV